MTYRQLYPIFRRRTAGVVLCLVAVLLISAGEKPQAEKKKAQPAATEKKSTGFLIRVPLPLDATADTRIKGMIKRALGRLDTEFGRPIIVFELSTGQSEFGIGSDFARAMSLASFITSRELAGVRTVAYISESVKGHGVLIAMACEEIIMAPEAELGEAGLDLPDQGDIGPTIRTAYKEIAQRRTIPPDVALGMLDRDLEILKVETAVSIEYLPRAELEKFEERTAVKSSEVLFPRGEMGHFTGREGRDLGFVKYLAEDSQAVAEALELPESALREDPSLGHGWIPIEVRLEGKIKPHVIARLMSMLEQHLKGDQVNFVALRIDSEGGSLSDAVQLANYLLSTRMDTVRTVAYVSEKAQGEAALIAVACDELIMHPEAVVGGTGNGGMTEEEIENGRAWIKDQLATSASRNWSLLAALIDPEIRVFRFKNSKTGRVEYFSDEEMEALENPEVWQRGEEVTAADRVLEVTGNEALDLQLATAVVNNFEELKQHYGLETDPKLIQPIWVDTVVEALARPELAWLMLVIGGVAIMAELQMPGIGIGGFVALVCFLLFFWSKFLVQTANWLEVMLFLGGLCCLLLEIFVLPGFGIFGLGGGLLILASLILASQTFVLPSPDDPEQMKQLRNSLLVVSAAGVGILGLGGILRRYLPDSPLFRPIMLAPPKGEELDDLTHREAVADFSFLLGRTGRATTAIAPCGKAQFEERLVDVMSEGELIERGATVDVVEVRGNQVIVQTVEN